MLKTIARGHTNLGAEPVARANRADADTIALTATGSASIDSRELQTPKTDVLIEFDYRAVDSTQEICVGIVKAVDKDAAVAEVRALGLRPIEVSIARHSWFQAELSIPGFGPKVSKRESAVFARQFATMSGAGVPLLRTLSILIDQTTNPLLRSTLESVRLDVEAGRSLSRAMSKHPAVFDNLFVPMVEAGERSGALEEVLVQLAVTLERSAALQHRVRSALVYPIGILSLVALVVAAMLLFVVPVFTEIYADMGQQLPLPTRVLVGVSSALTSKLPVTLATLALLAYSIHYWKSGTEGKLRWDRLKLRLPIVGEIVQNSAIARLSSVLSVLDRSGVPLLDSLNIAALTVDNSAIENAVLQMRSEVAQGGGIAANMEDHEFFPPVLVQLVSVGEQTGSLDEMLQRVSDSLTEQVESSIEGFSSLIEPLLMAFIGVVVGGMVVSLYLPMFRLVDLVQ